MTGYILKSSFSNLSSRNAIMNVYARDRYPAIVKKQSFLVLEVYRLYLKNNMTGNLAKRKKIEAKPISSYFFHLHRVTLTKPTPIMIMKI